MADWNGAWIPPHIHRHHDSSDSNSFCLHLCSGKYNQSISHLQIPIICNFMGDKPIWYQNDPLNVCMQHPNEPIRFFYYYYLLSCNPGERFLEMELGREIREKCQRMSQHKNKNVPLWQFFDMHLILPHKFAQTSRATNSHPQLIT